MMHMMVCSEWAESDLSSRVAPQEHSVYTLLSQQNVWDESFFLISGR